LIIRKINNRPIKGLLNLRKPDFPLLNKKQMETTMANATNGVFNGFYHFLKQF
jgi:hypothetical protein